MPGLRLCDVGAFAVRTVILVLEFWRAAIIPEFGTALRATVNHMAGYTVRLQKSMRVTIGRKWLKRGDASVYRPALAPAAKTVQIDDDHRKDDHNEGHPDKSPGVVDAGFEGFACVVKRVTLLKGTGVDDGGHDLKADETNDPRNYEEDHCAGQVHAAHLATVGVHGQVFDGFEHLQSLIA